MKQQRARDWVKQLLIAFSTQHIHQRFDFNVQEEDAPRTFPLDH
jgi:hypothetical protein